MAFDVSQRLVELLDDLELAGQLLHVQVQLAQAVLELVLERQTVEVLQLQAVRRVAVRDELVRGRPTGVEHLAARFGIVVFGGDQQFVELDLVHKKFEAFRDEPTFDELLQVQLDEYEPQWQVRQFGQPRFVGHGQRVSLVETHTHRGTQIRERSSDCPILVRRLIRG